MKTIPSLLLLLATVSAAEGLQHDFLYADSTVNKELHSLVFPVPEKFGKLTSFILSREKLDSLARHEMGKVTVYRISGQSSSGKYLTVGNEGVAFGENLIRFREIDYLEYQERKSFGGFLGVVSVVGLFSGVFFGAMEATHWLARGEYDYKRVLVYSGAMAGISAVMYFPTNTRTRVGFKFKD